MRTTLDIDDAILAAALAHRPATGKAYRLKWQTRRGRMLSGVDIGDRDRLYDVMDGRR